MNTVPKMVVGVIVAVLVVVGAYWILHSHSGDGLANISTSADAKLTSSQVQEVLTRIGEFLVLPTGESPSVSIIRDAMALAQEQSFYAGASNGDILVVYSNRAIVYDPKADKLVNVSAIVQGSASPSPVASGSMATVTPSGTPAAPEKVKVDVLNGSTKAGLAGVTASALKKNTWVTIGVVGDAKGTYTDNVIVDLTKGKKPNAIAALEQLYGVTSTTALPKGEATSTADIVIIVAK